MSLEGQKCCAQIGAPRLDFRTGKYVYATCPNKANRERDGKFYCGVHDPEKGKARRAARDAKWKHEWDIITLKTNLAKVRNEIADRAIECQPPIDDMHIDRLITKAKAIKAEIEALEASK